MKGIITTLSLCVSLAASGIASADTYVNPYVRSDGTYVQGHMRSDPDGSRLNNWSTRGNVNPYTGQPGYKDPYSNGYGFSSDRRSRSRLGGWDKSD